MAIRWVAGKGLDLLQVDLVLTRVKKEQAKRASLRSRKKKIQGLLLLLLRKSKKSLKKTKCPAVRTFSRISTKSLVLIV